MLFLGFPARRDEAAYLLSATRNNEAGELKKCAILFVVCFTFLVNLEMPMFFKKFKALPKLGSGQLLFLGSNGSGLMFGPTALRALEDSASGRGAKITSAVSNLLAKFESTQPSGNRMIFTRSAKCIAFVLLALAIGACEAPKANDKNANPPSTAEATPVPVPVPVPVQFAANLQLAQRTTTFLLDQQQRPTPVLISLDDITGNQVIVSLRTDSGRALVVPRSMYPRNHLVFAYQDARYRLQLLRLDNQLIGVDYAWFSLQPDSDATANASTTTTNPTSSITAENAKIELLLGALGQLSDAQFVRNAQRYSGDQAQAHLRQKWQAAAAPMSADEFITQIAERSSATGALYQIEFADGRVENAGDFLRKVLMRIEQASSAN